MSHRLPAAATVLVALLLAGCASSVGSGGSSQSPAPIESVSDSGAVAYAGVKACPEGPPASGFLNKVGDPQNDGVVGAFRNESGSRIYVGTSAGDLCFLENGRRAAYAASKSGWYEIRNDATRRANYVEVTVAVEDPNTGYPRVSVPGYTKGSSDVTKPCVVDGNNKSVTLSEGSRQEIGGIGAGTLWAERLPDNKAVAREWTGADSWAVNDWARIDLIVRPEKACP